MAVYARIVWLTTWRGLRATERLFRGDQDVFDAGGIAHGSYHSC